MDNKTLIEPISVEQSNQPVNTEQIEREKKIKQLSENLRFINKSCEGICTYLEFQKNMSPQMKTSLIMNQIVMMSLGIKTYLTTDIDNKYLDINQPPENVNNLMADTKENLEKTFKGLIDNLTASIIHIQNHTHSCESLAPPSMINEMNKEQPPNKYLPK